MVSLGGKREQIELIFFPLGSLLKLFNENQQYFLNEGDSEFIILLDRRKEGIGNPRRQLRVAVRIEFLPYCMLSF